MSIFDIFRKKKRIPAPWKKYYSSDELNIKIPNITMYDQVRESSLKYGDLVAVEYLGKKIKYRKFIKLIDRACNSFYKMGVRRGDIVTICLPNVPEALISLYALNKIGAIANMIHPLSSEDEIKDSIISTNSKYFIVCDILYDKIDSFIKDTMVKRTIVVSVSYFMPFFLKCGYNITNMFKYKHFYNDSFYIKFKSFMMMSCFKKYNFNYSLGKNSPAVILHSGGTSGKPKNVVLQNRAFILGSMQEKIALKKLNVGDCCLAIMPNFHGFGLSVCMHTPLCLGCYTILVPQFDSKKFDVLFNKKKPTCVLGVPTLFEALISCSNVKNLDLSFLKYVVSGGDSLNPKLEERINCYLASHNSSAKITQGYGMSEALAAVCLAHDDVNKSGSVGIPLPGNYIKIIDSNRKTVPYGEVGEIVINSKALMMGYLNDETETNSALQIHKDGHIWLHTGDLGYMDEDGFVFYKSRAKRMIITSGYNVYPSHIEEIIESHPAVLQCTVVGVPHPYKQEVGKAFIVLKEGYHWLFVKGDIKKLCTKKLAKYMIPKYFVFRKRLPKTKLGKVDFNALKNDIDGDDDE